MRVITLTDRILLSICALLAAYPILYGVDSASALATICYTIAFGVLLVAALLLIIMGFEVLPNPLVVVISTIIPLSFSLGLVAQYYPAYTAPYLLAAATGFTAVAYTRYFASHRAAVLVLIAVHGISGLLIFTLPLIQTLNGAAEPGFMLVSLGGALFGLGGILLSFLRTGKPIFSQDTILTILPLLMLLTTAACAAGFSLA